MDAGKNGKKTANGEFGREKASRSDSIRPNPTEFYFFGGNRGDGDAAGDMKNMKPGHYENAGSHLRYYGGYRRFDSVFRFRACCGWFRGGTQPRSVAEVFAISRYQSRSVKASPGEKCFSGQASTEA